MSWIIASIGLLTVPLATAEEAVEFNRDIRPILTDRCFACHGPDAETVEGGLRIDLREDAVDAGAIIPGSADKSEVVRRILSDEDDEVMPPVHLHKPLDKSQKELIQRWINQGAEYQLHWAYTDLKPVSVPELEDVSWGANEIDRFVLARLQQHHVAPSPKADPVTLLRRLSFDLTGLPPTKVEVEAFLTEPADEAYSTVVKRLLASERYGERMAVYWLDLVRYADTVGYHGDQDVSQSPYRDYVINAFNNNLPYDQFIRAQLAGDLLPDHTLQQLVASGYNRLNQTTEEGGAQAKEYLAIYFADRVRNVSQVFMGATVGCAQCHDHKYDPYTAKDFYSLGAFFADLDEQGKYSNRNRNPVIPVPTTEQVQEIAAIDKQITASEASIAETKQRLMAEQPAWETASLTAISKPAEPEDVTWIDDTQETGGQNTGGWKFVTADKAPVHSGKNSRVQSGNGTIQHFFNGATIRAKVDEGTQLYGWVYLDAKNPPSAVMLQFNDGGAWDHRAVWGSSDIEFGRRDADWNGYRRQGKRPETGKWVRLAVSAESVGFKPGDQIHGMAFTQFDGTAYWDRAGWVGKGGLPDHIAQFLTVDQAQRTDQQRTELQQYYFSVASALVQPNSQLQSLKAEKQAVLDRSVKTVVSRSVKPRPIRLLHRGNWMDETGEFVQPAIPEFLGTLDTNGNRATRLDLANWLCRSDNVLTARTMVNRLWYLMFGRGICASVDDFGGQGTFPSHPELLDYLAVEFVQSGWDIKHILQLIVTSDTYQQSSKPTAQALQDDPYNELFARQGRFRVSAEMVRDTSLLLSGLLVQQVGGRSVKPYQPPGYYDQLNFPKRNYEADKGDNQYRRGVYTHWQRTFLHPMLKAFDAPSREECTAMRSRSNTPLQALTLLNDPTFVEAARVFAVRILREGGTSLDRKIEWAHMSVVSRVPDEFVAKRLKEIYLQHRKYFDENPEQAKQLVTQGNASVDVGVDSVDVAAWASVSRVLFNLKEAYTRY